MPSPFVVCASCRCHVRSAARACPHCHANLTAPAALRLIRPLRREVRRQFFAAALGFGVAACGLTEPGGPGPQRDPHAESAGDSGARDSGGAVEDSGSSDSGPGDSGAVDSGLVVDAGLDPSVWGSCAPGLQCGTACYCGWNGLCNAEHNGCVSCGCDAGYQCLPWSGTCSNHTCYGAPPLLDEGGALA